jgi:hypothetical protein
MNQSLFLEYSYMLIRFTRALKIEQDKQPAKLHLEGHVFAFGHTLSLQACGEHEKARHGRISKEGF